MGNLLEVDDLQIELITAHGRHPRRRRRHLHHRRRRDRHASSASPAPASPPPRWACCGCCPTTSPCCPDRVQFKDCDVVGEPEGTLGDPRPHVALIPQDPMTALSPVHTIGRQLRDAVRHSGVRGKIRRDRACSRAARAGAHPGPAEQLVEVPAPALRRHAAAGPDRDRAGRRARLIVADEPTSALDVTVQASILDLLLELQERTGIGMLLITHDLGVARLVSDRIHVMKRRPLRRVRRRRGHWSTARRASTPRSCSPPSRVLGPWSAGARRRQESRHEPAPLLSVEDLVVEYPIAAGRRSAPSTSVSFSRGPRRTAGHRRRVRLRQVHDRQGPRAAAHPDLRAASSSTAPTSRTVGAGAAPAPPASRWSSRIPYGSLDPHLTAVEIVAEPLRLRGVRDKRERAQRAAELIDRVGLPDHRPAPPPRRVLRRAAPAHRHRPGPGQRTRAPGLRRGDQRPGRLRAGSGARPAARDAARHRTDLRVHLAQPRRGARDQRDRRRDVARARSSNRGPTADVLAHPREPYTRALRPPRSTRPRWSASSRATSCTSSGRPCQPAVARGAAS